MEPRLIIEVDVVEYIRVEVLGNLVMDLHALLLAIIKTSVNIVLDLVVYS